MTVLAVEVIQLFTAMTASLTDVQNVIAYGTSIQKERTMYFR